MEDRGGGVLSHREMRPASPLHHSPEDLPYSRHSRDKLKPDFMSSDHCSNSGPVIRKRSRVGAPTARRLAFL